MSQNLIDILTGVGVRDPFWRHREALNTSLQAIRTYDPYQ